MAIQKSFVDDFGATHAEAYTMVVNYAVFSNKVDLGIQVFHTAAARSKSDASAMKSALVNTIISIEGSDIATYFADGVLDDNNKSPLKQAYAYIKAQSDLLGQNWTTGTTDV